MLGGRGLEPSAGANRRGVRPDPERRHRGESREEHDEGEPGPSHRPEQSFGEPSELIKNRDTSRTCSHELLDLAGATQRRNQDVRDCDDCDQAECRKQKHPGHHKEIEITQRSKQERAEAPNPELCFRQQLDAEDPTRKQPNPAQDGRTRIEPRAKA